MLSHVAVSTQRLEVRERIITLLAPFDLVVDLQVLREAYEGREPEAVRRYEQRPKENNNSPSEDQAVIPDWQCLGSL